MRTFSRILRFIANIAKDEMFTTRQLLAFGERNSIDQTTCRLVKDGVIIRIAYGVFVIAGSNVSLITAEAVAQVKARAFERQIVEHASDVGKRIGIGGPRNPGPTFSTRSRSSSFMMLISNTRIYFKGVSARKFNLAGTRLGDILRALWNLSETGCSDAALDHIAVIMGRGDREQLPQYASRIPQWLHAHFGFAWA